MNNITYMDIPEEEREKLQFNLFSNAYPKQWIHWCDLSQNKDIVDILSETFEGLKNYSGMTLDETTMNNLYDTYFPPIWNSVLSNYTEDFRDELDGNSWGY